jgi:hypothetical protein
MDFEDILLVIAIFSSSFFALRIILMFMGLSDAGYDASIEVDGDFDHSSVGDLKLVSLLTIMAFLAVGSWTALAVHDTTDGNLVWTGLAGGAAGFVAMLAIAFMFSQIKRLEADGTLRDFDAKGLRGEAYVRIPPAGGGEGQVRLTVKGRLRTFRAVNEEDTAIESFRPVEVTGKTNDNVLRVRHTG